MYTLGLTKGDRVASSDLNFHWRLMAESGIERLLETAQNVEDIISQTTKQLNQLTASLPVQPNADESEGDERTFVDEMELIDDGDMKGFTQQIQANFDMNQIRQLFQPVADNQNHNDVNQESEDIDMNVLQNELNSFFGQNGLDSIFAKNLQTSDDDHQQNNDCDEDKYEEEDIEFEKDLSNMADLKNIFMQNISDKNANDTKQNEIESEMTEIEMLDQLELMQKSQVNDIELKKRGCKLNCQIINETYLKTQNEYYPLLLIHGLCGDRNIWNDLLPKLISYPNSIISVSLRGCGESKQSDVDHSTFSIGEYLDDMIVLLSALNISKAIWIGHGFGTFICQKAAVENEDIVHKMVLIAPHYTLSTDIGMKCKEILKNEGISGFVEKKMGNVNLLDGCQKCSVDILEKIIDSMMKFDSLKYLKYIECPVYILVGAQDDVFGQEAAYQMNKRIKSSLITCFPKAGHYLMCDKAILSRLGMIIWDFCRQR